MLSIEKIENNFIIYNEKNPIFGGNIQDYYIEKENIFSLKIISTLNINDSIIIKLSDFKLNNIKSLFLHIVEIIYGSNAKTLIDDLNNDKVYDISSIENFFMLSKHTVPYFCGMRNSVIIRSKNKQTYIYNKYTLKLIEKLDYEFIEGNDEDTDIIDKVNEEPLEDRIGLDFKGYWDSHNNVPNLNELDVRIGDYYKVSIPGNTDINGITDWAVNDWVIYIGDNKWEKNDQSNSVNSVNDKKGNVVLTTKDISDNDSDNKYFTSIFKDKLDSIEEGAEVNPNGLEIKELYEDNLDTNNFSNIYKHKLEDIEENAERNNILDDDAQNLTSGLESVLHKHDYNKLLNLPFIPTKIDDIDISSLQYVRTDNNFTNEEKSKLSNIEPNAEVNPSNSEIKEMYESNDNTNTFTDDEKDKLNNISEGAEVNPDGLEIKSLYESNTDTNAFTDNEKSKLNNIEDGAEKNLSNSEIKSSYESNSNTNAFTDTEKSKLEGIEPNAEVNPTNNEIKELYESNDNTNVFTDLHKSKLESLESSKFLGLYTTLDLLKSNHPSPNIGSYGHVDAGEGEDIKVYIWDDTDSEFVLQTGVTTSETSESIKEKYESNVDTNAFTDDEKSKLSGIELNAEVNPSNSEIKEMYESNDNTNTFTDIEKDKLEGIELNAQVNPSNNEIKSLYESNDNTNAFTDDEKSKLSGIEPNAEVNPDRSEIKALYESNTNTNAFTDTEKNKLSNIENNAQINPTRNEIKSLYESNTNTNAFTDSDKAKLNNLDLNKYSKLDYLINNIDSLNDDSIVLTINNEFRFMKISDFFVKMPKIISTIGTITILKGEKFEFQVLAEGENLIYELEDFPLGMTISSTGFIQYNSDNIGEHVITIKVSNTESELFTTQNFTLIVEGPKIGSKILHDNIIGLFIPKNYNKGDWKNQQNRKIFRKPPSSSRPAKQDIFTNNQAIYFDGDNDYTYKNSSYTLKSIIIYFKPEIGINQFSPIFGNYMEDLTISLYDNGSTQRIYLCPLSTNRARYVVNDQGMSDYITTGNFSWTNNQWYKLYVEYENKKTISNVTIGSLYPRFSLGQYEYKGHIGMIATYDGNLTTDQIEESFNWIDDNFKL